MFRDHIFKIATSPRGQWVNITLKNVVTQQATWQLNSCCPPLNVSCPVHTPSRKINEDIEETDNFSAQLSFGQPQIGNLVAPLLYFVAQGNQAYGVVNSLRLSDAYICQ